MSRYEGTFTNESNLPSLPVPELEDTIGKYLSSCRALLNEKEFQETEQVCSRFLKSPQTLQLQEKLLERASQRSNWLEEWWLDHAYLETRVPLPLINYSGPASYHEDHWPLKSGTQLQRSAWNIYFFYTFWEMLRKERLAVHRTSEGQALSMNQFRFLFNTCRRPIRGKDKMIHSFKTSSEGLGPTHALVMKRGRIFVLEGFDRKKEKIKSPQEILLMLQAIDEQCDSAGPSVGVLTTLDRDKWAEIWEYLTSMSEHNRLSMATIEDSLMVFCLDETSPSTYSEMCQAISLGNWHNRWYDKSYTAVSFTNGGFATNCDHTPCDAMVMAVLLEYNVEMLAKHGGDAALDVSRVKVSEQPHELEFELDERMRREIVAAKKHAAQIEQSVDLIQPVFKNFGKRCFKRFKLHPDFVVQISLQLAFMSMHEGRPAATYETAMTRRFFHGRTETCRTCTPDAVHFCRAMLRQTADDQRCVELLRLAQKKFLWLMRECSMNRGCDRHLFGLGLIARESNQELPELLRHTSYTLTGGNGNFELSTSCLGYGRIQGVVAPMTERGFGCFYRINDDKIVYSVTSFRANAEYESRSQNFADHFECSINQVVSLLHRATSSNL